MFKTCQSFICISARTSKPDFDPLPVVLHHQCYVRSRNGLYHYNNFDHIRSCCSKALRHINTLYLFSRTSPTPPHSWMCHWLPVPWIIASIYAELWPYMCLVCRNLCVLFWNQPASRLSSIPFGTLTDRIFCIALETRGFITTAKQQPHVSWL